MSSYEETTGWERIKFNMKRWSKLQRDIYKLLDPTINLQIHCSVYRMQSQLGSTDLPRYWITLGKQIIWDYPAQFIHADGTLRDANNQIIYYPYQSEISDISNIIREYINTPKDSLLITNFKADIWGITDILKASDRRLRLQALSQLRLNAPGQLVLASRIWGNTK